MKKEPDVSSGDRRPAVPRGPEQEPVNTILFVSPRAVTGAVLMPVNEHPKGGLWIYRKSLERENRRNGEIKKMTKS